MSYHAGEYSMINDILIFNALDGKLAVEARKKYQVLESYVVNGFPDTKDGCNGWDLKLASAIRWLMVRRFLHLRHLMV